MQVEELRNQIDSAFGAVGVPLAEQVLAPRYADAMDPRELLAAFRGKHWRDLSRRDVFIHRESLPSLSAVGFRAYVAAYLIASLEGEEAADLAEYTLFGLHPLSDTDTDETRDRLSALDGPQRAAIRCYLQHIQTEYPLASKVLTHWQS